MFLPLECGKLCVCFGQILIPGFEKGAASTFCPLERFL